MNSCNVVGVAVLALLITAQQCAGYRCYVCSWSPSSENRTDICTTENFNQNAAPTFDGCQYGCEIVAAYDKNDELEAFYRNCIVKGKEVTNDCREETNPAFRKHVCSCNSELCNSATVFSPALLYTLAAAALTISLIIRG